jgi:serine-type D-Ala-D-Ala carboxypeptidase (penicillin-binding protein 5/6)
MSTPSGRRSSTGETRRGDTPLQVVLITAVVALLLAGVAAALAGIHPARAARAAAHRPASSAPLSTAWLARHPQAALDVRGQAVVLIDVGSGQVLWERQPHQRRAPASLTKLMTAMVAADLAPLDRLVHVTGATDADAAREVEPTATVMGLTVGERLRVRDLLYGLFLRSGADAAETLAGGIVPRDQFVRLMNQKAQALHMVDSHFTTPVGLDDPAMRTTAYDVALASAAIVARYPALLAISGTPSITLPRTAGHKQFAMVNYNKLVLPGSGFTYAGATGMKTAFTDDAGQCMVATATRNGRRLVAVVMDSPVFFTDAVKLLDYGFATPLAHR